MKAGSTVIKRCNCKSKYQDSVHGKDLRVHTVGSDKSGTQSINCTICGPSPKSISRLVSHGRVHNKKIHG